MLLAGEVVRALHTMKKNNTLLMEPKTAPRYMAICSMWGHIQDPSKLSTC
jgi:hypothetical protein